jgi:hypothetical protein
MPQTLTSKLIVSLAAYLADTKGIAVANANIDKSSINVIASGTGANQADKVFSELAKSIVGNTDVDLAGSLTDAYGAVITFARVKMLAFFVDPASVSNLVVGAAAANQFFGPFGASAHTINIRPGGLAVLFAPDAVAWPVTAATADILRLAPSGASCLFDWCVMGASV